MERSLKRTEKNGTNRTEKNAVPNPANHATTRILPTNHHSHQPAAVKPSNYPVNQLDIHTTILLHTVT